LESDLLCGNAALPYLPPKDLVFPQSETLFRRTPSSSHPLDNLFYKGSGPLGVFLMSRRAGRWVERAILHGSGCSTEVQFPDFSLTHLDGEARFYEFRPKDWAWAVDMLEKGGFQQELEDFVRYRGLLPK
jgi:hypothetical protein